MTSPPSRGESRSHPGRIGKYVLQPWPRTSRGCARKPKSRVGALEQTKNGHWAFYAPDGKNIVHVGGTPSDRRAFDNTVAQMRQFGFQVEGTLSTMDIRFSVVFGPIEDLTPELVDDLLTQLLAYVPDNGPVISVDIEAATVGIVVTVDQDEPLTIGHLQSSPVEEVGVGIGKAMAEAGFRRSPPILRVTTEPVPADERELALA